jgi:SAM-dependent methyltransferase
MDDERGYLLDNGRSEAGDRFRALSRLFDASTARHLRALGVAPGWRVWEVGAGGPSVPAWLLDQVGPSGRVLATDIDTGWLRHLGERPGCEVRTHDVGADPTPGGPFDLVHARLLLVHLSHRDRALAAMVSALRPGGWLLLEEADPDLQPRVCPDETGPEQRLANRLKSGFRALMAERGVDLGYGRTLPRRLRDAGLLDVAADAYFPVTGPACAALEEATVRQIRDQLVGTGRAGPDEIDRHLAAVRSGRLDLATSPMVSSWGRAPG